MKKQIFSVTCFAIVCWSCSCQNSNNANDQANGPKPGSPIERLIEDLGLNEQQAADFRAVMDEMRPPRGDRQRPPHDSVRHRRPMPPKDSLSVDNRPPKDGKRHKRGDKPRPPKDSMQMNRPSREELQQRRDEMNAKIKKILTDEQYAKYQEIMKQHRRGPRGGGNPPAPPTEPMED